LPEGGEAEAKLLQIFGCERQIKAEPLKEDMMYNHYILALLSGAFENYLSNTGGDFHARKAFHSRLRYIGLGPRSMEEGGLIRFLQGYSRPVILRRAASNYFFVDQCWEN